MLKLLVLSILFVCSMAFEDQDILNIFIENDQELKIFLLGTADLPINNIRYIGNGHQRMTDLSSKFLRRIGKTIDDITREVDLEVVRRISDSLEELNLEKISKLPEVMDSIYPICRSAVKDFIMKSQIVPTICSFFKHAEYDENETLRVRRETNINSAIATDSVQYVTQTEDETRIVYKLRSNHENIIDNLFLGMIERLNDKQSDIIDDIHYNFVIQMHKSELIKLT